MLPEGLDRATVSRLLRFVEYDLEMFKVELEIFGRVRCRNVIV